MSMFIIPAIFLAIALFFQNDLEKGEIFILGGLTFLFTYLIMKELGWLDIREED
jgi:hypothetical protein